MKLSSLLITTAQEAYRHQDVSTGAFQPGHNGPYHDPETPVRCTSHWLITLSKAYQLTQHATLLAAAERALTYLESPSARPGNASFHYRTKAGKDTCNGLIGQAWTIEALAEAGRRLNRPEAIDLGVEMFLLHPFDERIGVWQRVEVDGRVLSIDPTFNHQLWFAAAGSLLDGGQRELVRQRVRRFLDRLPDNLAIYRSGLIRHPLKMAGTLTQRVRRNASLAVRPIKAMAARRAMKHKAIGYHAFNLYALSMLRAEFPEHVIWRNEQVKATIEYVRSGEFREGLEANKYGFPYNPPGFEVAYALQTFVADSLPLQQKWVSEQIFRTFDFRTNLMERDTEDPVTLAARIYEATRLQDLELDVHRA